MASSESGVDPNSVQSQISPSVPRYSYYHYPDSDAIIFAYTCPSGASIKERMVYASSRNNAYYLAVDNGLKISKKVRGVFVIVVSMDQLCLTGCNNSSRLLLRMRFRATDCTKRSIRHRTREPVVDLPDPNALAGKKRIAKCETPHFFFFIDSSPETMNCIFPLSYSSDPLSLSQ